MEVARGQLEQLRKAHEVAQTEVERYNCNDICRATLSLYEADNKIIEQPLLLKFLQ